jgi:hypothetical protein
MERLELQPGQRAAADSDLGALVEPVELEVDMHSECRERGREVTIARQPDPAGVQHHERDPARPRRCKHLEDLGMDRRLAAGELDGLGLSLGSDESVEHRLHLREAEREPMLLVAGARLGKAHRAVEVVGGVHLDDPQTRVLLVLRAEAAVKRTAS